MSWEVIKTILCFWQWIPFLLRRQLPEQEIELRPRVTEEEKRQPPTVLVLIGAANHNDGTASPQGQAIVVRAQEYLQRYKHWAPGMVILCVSGNTLGGKTEAEALMEECHLQGVSSTVKEIVCLDPVSESAGDMRRKSKERGGDCDWFMNPVVKTTNTWENIQRVLDYCYYRGWKNITLVGHPIHLTYAWPILLYLRDQAKRRLDFYYLRLGMLNSRQTQYNKDSPQPRWRSYWRFWWYAVLAKGK